MHDHIHRLHRYRPKQHLITHHHSCSDTVPAQHLNLDRPDIAHQLARAIRQMHLALLEVAEAKLNCQMLGNYQIKRASIDQRADADFFQFGVTEV